MGARPSETLPESSFCCLIAVAISPPVFAQGRLILKLLGVCAIQGRACDLPTLLELTLK
jgi:hypothetical protein